MEEKLSDTLSVDRLSKSLIDLVVGTERLTNIFTKQPAIGYTR